jgi:hypothetical protein
MKLEDVCSQRPGGDPSHCFHGTGVARLTDPPQTEEKCCFCGLIRYKWLVVDPPRLKEHGTFLPGGPA